jgi:branched-chain amino acid transport system substrate-binding protein
MKRGHVGLAIVATGAMGLGVFAGVGVGGQKTANAVPKELKLGILVPLSGPLKPFGGPAQKAAQLAANQLNAAAKKAGIAFTIKTSVANSQTDPTAAQKAATKLIDGNHVNCIAGPMASSEVTSVAQNVSVDSGIPIVSPSSTAPSVRTDVKNDRGLVFRTPPPDTLQGPILAQQVKKAVGTGTVNIAYQNDAYGSSLQKIFSDAFKKLGGKVGSSTPFNPSATSFDTEAAKIVDGNPAAFVIITFTDQYKILAPALVRTGKWDPKKTWGTDGIRDASLPAAGAEISEGVRGTSATDRGNSLAPAFDKLWKRSKNGPRQTYDAQMFDAAVLCGLSAVKAQSTDGTKIAKQIRGVSAAPGTKYTFLQLDKALKAVAAGKDIDYVGASGPVDLGKNGDVAIGDYEVWSYTGGKLVDGKVIIKAR